MMKFLFRLFPVVLMVSSFASCMAQANSKNEAKQKRVPAEDGKHLVWEISGNGLTKPSYLMGTIHMICKEQYFWTPAMQAAFDNAEKVCMEMDMDDPSLQMKVAMGLMLPAGQSLKDYFTGDEYAKLEAYLKDNLPEMPMPALERMKPVVIMTMLSEKGGSCEVTESYELNLLKKANDSKKEILGLETAEDQLKALDKLAGDSVANYIMNNIVSTGDQGDTTFNALMNAYTKEDLPQLYTLILQSQEFSADLDGLLFDRNLNWIPKMTKMMAEQPTLFAVGAGHLWGDRGVIRLLRKEGYTVRPVVKSR